MSRPIAAALYSLDAEARRDFGGALERVAEIGFLGVELESFHGMAPAELRSRLDGLGLTVTSAQVDLTPEDAERLLDEQEVVGNRRVITDFGPEDFATPDALARTAEEFNELAALVRARGMTLGYHNHWWEFTPSGAGELPAVELLRRLDPDVFLEIDLYYVQTAWERTRANDPVAALGQLAERARLVHVKDGPCTEAASPEGAIDVAGLLLDPSTAIGDGILDVPALLAALPQADWHIVEVDTTVPDMFDVMADSYRHLTERGLSHGRS